MTAPLMDALFQCQICGKILWAPEADPPPFTHVMPAHNNDAGLRCPGSEMPAAPIDRRPHEP